MFKTILMICKGNICRSPIAEAVMKHLIQKANLSNEWKVDSAGMDDEWHGYPPDDRALKILKKYNLPYNNTAREMQKNDFYDFDYIFGMDERNMDFLKRKAPKDSKTKLFLLGDFGLPIHDKIIRDPYYDHDERNFEVVYQQCLVACNAFLKKAVAHEV